MDVRDYNKQAWDGQVARRNRWTVAVGPEVVAEARAGRWSIVLTPTKPVPREWFPELRGAEVLGLASGGGQQGPVLAAAGARVTVLDQSPAQLAQDRAVAARDGLDLATVEGDMADLRRFADRSFDLVVHPCANAFVPDIRPVWREAFRVLRPGGLLLSGFVNPAAYIFDEFAARDGRLEVRHRLPYSDAESLTAEDRQRFIELGEPFVFSHSLEEQLGGQLEAGFVLTHLYEDSNPEDLASRYLPLALATRALKPR